MDQTRIGTLAMQVNLWASLGYGLMLLLVPDVFCDLLRAEAVNTAWLRTIGAALIGTNVVGSWLWLRSPGMDMGRVQFATAALEAAAMGISLVLDEFTAQNLWMVQASVVLAIVVGCWALPDHAKRDVRTCMSTCCRAVFMHLYGVNRSVPQRP